MERAFSARVAELPAATRTVLLVAAINDTGVIAEVLNAVSGILQSVVTIEAFETAIAGGLVRVDAMVLQFRHPLVRPAIHQAAGLANRQIAHVTLADALVQQPDRQAWHRAAAAVGPDEHVARELEKARARAVARGAMAVAAEALGRAAELTAVPSRRGGLLVRAAELEFGVGRSHLALRLFSQAQQLELEHDQRVVLLYLLEAADEDRWSGAARVTSFVEIATDPTRADGPELALKLLLTAARGCWWGNPAQNTRDLVVTAVERTPWPIGLNLNSSR